LARKLFGTDGVRGEVGTFLTTDLARALGRAATAGAPAARPRVLIVRDTRESGPALEAALATGVTEAGGDALLGGVLPTPAAPLLVRRYGFDLAAVISASHNPFGDNGIKFFGPDGFKLADAAELEIERALDDPAPPAGDPGRIEELHGTEDDYLRELTQRFAGLDLTGVRVLLDCAHGASHRVGPEIFRRLGAEVTAEAAAPDGRNINAECGSTHIGALQARIAEGGHDVGFAFDGDADRVLAVDRTGTIVDGDELLALAALHKGVPGVAVTVMTNFGFHAAMERAGIEVATTQVGDRYVLEALRERGWELGGEQSGHIIDMGFCPSGDGVASALLTLEALAGADLAERHAMEKLPQVLVNVRVGDRDAATSAPEIGVAVAREEAALAGRGRVLLRPSGTEPLVRVMVEAPTRAEAEEVCRRLVEIVTTAAGQPA
jgi:phosphoglucosamine mutase